MLLAAAPAPAEVGGAHGDQAPAGGLQEEASATDSTRGVEPEAAGDADVDAGADAASPTAVGRGALGEAASTSAELDPVLDPAHEEHGSVTGNREAAALEVEIRQTHAEVGADPEVPRGPPTEVDAHRGGGATEVVVEHPSAEPTVDVGRLGLGGGGLSDHRGGGGRRRDRRGHDRRGRRRGGGRGHILAGVLAARGGGRGQAKLALRSTHVGALREQVNLDLHSHYPADHLVELALRHVDVRAVDAESQPGVLDADGHQDALPGARRQALAGLVDPLELTFNGLGRGPTLTGPLVGGPAHARVLPGGAGAVLAVDVRATRREGLDIGQDLGLELSEHQSRPGGRGHVGDLTDGDAVLPGPLGGLGVVGAGEDGQSEDGQSELAADGHDLHIGH